MKPTEEQIKEFWEWCGFEELPTETWNNLYGEAPNPIILVIDLNNLFKYAVPKLEADYEVTLRLYDGLWKVTLFALTQPFLDSEKDDVDPTLALFWAIWEVIKDGRNTL